MSSVILKLYQNSSSLVLTKGRKLWKESWKKTEGIIFIFKIKPFHFDEIWNKVEISESCNTINLGEKHKCIAVKTKQLAEQQTEPVWRIGGDVGTQG